MAIQSSMIVRISARVRAELVVLARRRWAITRRRRPQERRWFPSITELARRHSPSTRVSERPGVSDPSWKRMPIPAQQAAVLRLRAVAAVHTAAVVAAAAVEIPLAAEWAEDEV